MRYILFFISFVLFACSGTKGIEDGESSCKKKTVSITNIDELSLDNYVYVEGILNRKRIIILLSKSDKNELKVLDDMISDKELKLCLNKIYFLKSDSGPSVFFYRGDVHVNDKLLFPNSISVYEVDMKEFSE